MRSATAIICLLLAALPLAARAQGFTSPIPGDGDWTLTKVPTGGGCFARLAGPQVDTMVMVNRDDKLVLSIGRQDWNLPAGDTKVQLQIDGGAPHLLAASPVGNIVLVVIDNALRDPVLKARNLSWTLPQGRYSAPVTGIGRAFAAVIPCGLPAAQATAQ